MQEPQVQVLMSTYNGDRYLQEQLDSIYAQRGVNCALLVRDDGSSDCTRQLLDKEQANGRLRWYAGENLGPARSFWNLILTASGADYYALSDQDDVWLEDKLSAAMKMISQTPDSKPALYFGQTQLVDERLNTLQSVPIHPLLSYSEALVYQFIGGCTMVMNEALRKKLAQYTPTYLYMHDFWIYDVALAIGADVYFDPTPHILYRQHTGNVVGQLSTSRFKWKSRINRMLKNEHIRLRTAQELWNGYKDLMPPQNELLTQSIVQSPHNLRAKLRLVFGGQLNCSRRSVLISSKIALLTNFF